MADNSKLTAFLQKDIGGFPVWAWGAIGAVGVGAGIFLRKKVQGQQPTGLGVDTAGLGAGPPDQGGNPPLGPTGPVSPPVSGNPPIIGNPPILGGPPELVPISAGSLGPVSSGQAPVSNNSGIFNLPGIFLAQAATDKINEAIATAEGYTEYQQHANQRLQQAFSGRQLTPIKAALKQRASGAVSRRV